LHTFTIARTLGSWQAFTVRRRPSGRSPRQVPAARRVTTTRTEGPTPMETRLLYRPEEAAAALSLGRSKVFELMADGRLKSVQIGRARRITSTALHDYVTKLAAEEPDETVTP